MYSATVVNVSRTRGVTVRYPENADFNTWTECLSIEQMTAERVSRSLSDEDAALLKEKEGTRKREQADRCAADEAEHSGGGEKRTSAAPLAKPAAKARKKDSSWADKLRAFASGPHSQLRFPPGLSTSAQPVTPPAHA